MRDLFERRSIDDGNDWNCAVVERRYCAAGLIFTTVGVGQAPVQEIAGIRIQEGPDNPSLEIIIRSLFAELEVATNIRYAAADQSAIDPHDTFYNFLETAWEAEPPFGNNQTATNQP